MILYVCPLTKKWSVILTVYLNSERQNNNKKISKCISKSYELICILMSQISIWSPINQQDFWLPGVLYTGKELRLGALS